MVKEIKFNRQDKDYAAYLNGILVGFYATHQQAQTALDQAAFDQLSD